MIGFDTNMLTRLITEDDTKQFSNVLDLVYKYRALDETIYLDDIVICELVWVLGSTYKYTKIQVSIALETLFSSDTFVFRNIQSLQNAFELYKSGKADFSDYLICERTKEAGCITIYSFDKQPIKEGIFVTCNQFTNEDL